MGMKDQKDNRVSFEASILSSMEIYTLIVKNLPIGFSLIDKSGIILEFNSEAEKLTGYSKGDVYGKSHLEIMHGSKDPGSCPLFTHVFKEHEPSVASEMVMKRKNGDIVTLLVMAFPLFDPSGSFIGGAELFRDISEQKRMEREHKNLLSMFAHDMKNPVVAATGFLARLLSGKAGPLNDKQMEYANNIMGSVTKLQRFISDFLEFSRLEDKRYVPVPAPCNIEEAIQGQIGALSNAAEKKGIQLVFEYAQDELPVVYVDAVMIDRVLSNLLTNAIKYTDTGGKVTVRLTNRTEDVLIEVLDTGIGIREQDMPCVFDTFCRVNRDTEGSGLGLAIARAIIEAHHGTLSVESEPGKGSRFWFTIPKRPKI